MLESMKKIKIIKKKFRQRHETPQGLLNQMSLNNKQVTVQTPTSRPKCLMRIMSAQNLQLPKIQAKIAENIYTENEPAGTKTNAPDHLINIKQSKTRLLKKLNQECPSGEQKEFVKANKDFQNIKETAGMSVQNQMKFLKE